jgi:hypothetical protein
MAFTKEEARIKIQKLVENFHAHEAQIENNFIRPLFRYLNWNTENEGLSHAPHEIKLQATNKKDLRPDYALNPEGRDELYAFRWSRYGREERSPYSTTGWTRK